MLQSSHENHLTPDSTASCDSDFLFNIMPSPLIISTNTNLQQGDSSDLSPIHEPETSNL